MSVYKLAKLFEIKYAFDPDVGLDDTSKIERIRQAIYNIALIAQTPEYKGRLGFAEVPVTNVINLVKTMAPVLEKKYWNANVRSYIYEDDAVARLKNLFSYAYPDLEKTVAVLSQIAPNQSQTLQHDLNIIQKNIDQIVLK